MPARRVLALEEHADLLRLYAPNSPFDDDVLKVRGRAQHAPRAARLPAPCGALWSSSRPPRPPARPLWVPWPAPEGRDRYAQTSVGPSSSSAQLSAVWVMGE